MTSSSITRWIRFLAVSLIGTGVDTLVLWLCSSYLLNGTYWGENILSPILSFWCAASFNFSLFYCFVWRERISSLRSLRSILRHYFGYLGSVTGGFTLKMCILLLIQQLSHWDVVWCNLIALCFSGLFNFLMDELVIFRKKKCK